MAITGFEGIVLLMGILRFYSRASIDGTLGWDDYIMAAALVHIPNDLCSNSVDALHRFFPYHLPFWVVFVSSSHSDHLTALTSSKGAAYGFGRNIWEIQPDDLTKALKVTFQKSMLHR